MPVRSDRAAELPVTRASTSPIATRRTTTIPLTSTTALPPVTSCSLDEENDNQDTTDNDYCPAPSQSLLFGTICNGGDDRP
uniref:Uncharacterized protein n=1 Tax=Steinernema glaseri TaxID=37863 RepID=A0A1I8A7T3_9BILA